MRHLLSVPSQLLSYTGAVVAFFYLRVPLVQAWWTEFHSDYALVGLMAQHTKAGSFPVFFYGQNYMGGLEWLTAAALSLLYDQGPEVSLEVLRWNSLIWWFVAGVAWCVALRLWSATASVLFGWLFAFGSFHLQKVSVLQELCPQFLFFGAVILGMLAALPDLKGRRGLAFGAVLGVAWWTNQTVVFFLLPALLLFQSLPGGWHRSGLARDFFRPRPRLKPLYVLGALLVVSGVAIGALGGLRLSILKIPNGISLARDAVLVVFILQLLGVFREWLKEGKVIPRLAPLIPFVAGFVLGFSPVWLGRILGWYEKGYGIGLAILPFWKWPGQLRAVITSTGELVFSGLWIPTLIGILVVAAGIWLGVLKEPRSRRLLAFSALVILLNAAYVAFSERSLGVPLRYLYPSYLALLLALSVCATQAGPLLVRSGLTFLLLLAFGVTGINSRAALLWEAKAIESRKQDLDNLLEVLGPSGFRHCWGDYWTSYLVTYLTQERLIVSPHPASSASQVRVKAYQEAVKAADPSCYLFREGDAATAKIYLTDKNPWEAK